MMAVIAVVLTMLGLIVLAVILVLVRMLSRKQDTGPAMDEARMVQELYRTLERMENRVDVLETLLAGHSDTRKPDNAPLTGDKT